MTTSDERQPPRRLTWPDVTALGILVTLLIAGGLMALACLGKVPPW